MKLGELGLIKTNSSSAADTFKEIRKERIEAHFKPMIHDLDFLTENERDGVVI